MTNSGQQEEEKEELDFMDDSYLLQATHADQQRHVKSSRPSTAATSKSSQVQGSRKEREKIARDKGLSTSLLPARSGREGQHHIQGGSDKRINDGSEGELGSEGNRKGEGGEMTWAQKMVLKMMSGSSESSAASPSTNESKRSTSGFRGDEDQDDEARPKQKQRKLSPTSSSSIPREPASSISEPLQIDLRWIGGSSIRHGIGSRAVSKAIKEASAPEAKEARERKAQALMDDFRSRTAAEHQSKHTETLIKKARKTCEELDRENGIQYSPLWLEPSWLSVPSESLSAEINLLVSYAFSLDSAESSSNKQEPGIFEQRLEEDPSGSASLEPKKDNLEAKAKDEMSIQEERRDEAKRFCSLDAATSLSLTLSHLRISYFYCLFCGCKYSSDQELMSHCPGEEEEDHD